MGKERLAPSGYYIEFFGVWKPNPNDKEFSIIHISEEGKCKYMEINGGSKQWNTLLWSCAPTRIMVAKSNLDLSNDMIGRFLFFKDLKSLKAYPRLGRYKKYI